MIKALPLVAIAALSLAFQPGCATKTPPVGAAGPVEAVQAFSAAVARGDIPAAFALLSSRTQREADELAAGARGAAGGDAGPGSGRQMLFSAALPQGKISARELSQQGDGAEVSVTDASGKAQTFHTVREDGVWRIDLRLAGK